MPFYPFLQEGSATKIDYRIKGTLILTSLLEDLDHDSTELVNYPAECASCVSGSYEVSCLSSHWELMSGAFHDVGRGVCSYVHSVLNSLLAKIPQMLCVVWH